MHMETSRGNSLSDATRSSMTQEAAGLACYSDEAPVIAHHGVDVEPALDRAQVLRSAEMAGKTLPGCLVEDQAIRTMAAHRRAEHLEQVDHELRYGSLLETLEGVLRPRRGLGRGGGMEGLWRLQVWLLIRGATLISLFSTPVSKNRVSLIAGFCEL